MLVLTNYVMLNLFVGMIMNNFAYICSKDDNGGIFRCSIELGSITSVAAGGYGLRADCGVKSGAKAQDLAFRRS